MHRRFVAPLAALVTLTTAVKAQSPDSTPPRFVRLTAPVEVEMLNAGSDESPLPAVEVMINGHGPYRFGIETGARFLVLSSEVAAGARLVSRGNQSDIVEYHADSIAIGGAVIGDVTLATLPRMPRGVDGLLGLPAFADLSLTLDYARRVVRLTRDTLPSADGRNVLPMTRAGPFIAIAVRYGSHVIPTIIDTRSMTAFGVEPSTAQEFIWKTPPQLAGRAGGAGIPTTEVSRGVLGESIGLGRYELTSAPIVIHALPPDFPHDPRIGAGALKYFVLTLDQRTSRARLTRDSTTTIDFGAPASSAATPIAAAQLGDYVGTYGERTISIRTGSLFLQRVGGEPLEMVPAGADEFTLRLVPAAKIQFTRDARGKVIELAVLAPSGSWERAKRAP